MAFSLKLTEHNGLIREEPTYKLGALVSDIGGALGLICGLSILDILFIVTNFVKKAIKRFFGLFNTSQKVSGLYAASPKVTIQFSLSLQKFHK